MNRLLLTLLLAANFSVITLAQNPPKREFRGAWIATFSNIDWPSRTQTPAQQRSAFLTIIDHHKATGMNAIFGQVRSQCDALYPSTIEPWSADLTGLQGRAPSPMWDPMQFMIDETHKRGMEFHAWINPYRAVATASNLSGFSASHVAKQHPEWLLTTPATITLNPALPEVRDYILSVIVDILNRYDVDGIHFDDYFYPPGVYNDDASFAAYPRGFTSKADWRRDNVNLLIKRVYDSVKAIKPWVKFGVSPSGIYRNSTNPAIGSPTSGNEHYNAVFADSKKWLQEGWIDYLAPQVYWYMGQPGANYSLIVPWWNNNTFGRNMYIGMAGYKVNDAAAGLPWTQPTMIPNEVRLNRNQPNIHGQAIYNTSSLRSATRLGFRDSLRLFFFNKPALLPLMPWRDNTPPEAPSALTATRGAGDSVFLNWTKPADAANELDKAKRFVVYRSAQPDVDLTNANNILAITANDTSGFAYKNTDPGTVYYYAVTSIDRFHNESTPSNRIADVAPSIVCPGDQKLELATNCLAIMPDYSSLVTYNNATTIEQSPVAGAVFNEAGARTVTIKVTNAVGQTAACSFQVAIEDKKAPQVTPVDPRFTNGSTTVVSTETGSCSFSAGKQFDVVGTDGCNTNLQYSYTLTQQGATSAPVSGSTLDGKTLPKGLTTITWTVRDASGNTATYQFSIQVDDTEAPVYTVAPGNLAVSTDPGICGAAATITAPAAADNCGVVSNAGIRSDGKTLQALYPVGTTTITWTATDAAGNSTTVTQDITVQDNEAPVITNVSADPAALWPPNHKMRNVTVSYNTSDNCGVTATSISVSSNEPVNGTGDGDTGPDWEIIDNHRLKLRAERSGSGNGRIYTITIKAEDAAGNTSTQTVDVIVPHDHSEVTIRKGDGTIEEAADALEVKATPNPSRDQFTLLTRSYSKGALGIRVMDEAGRVIESRTGLPANGRIVLGANYKPGVYLVEISQGSEKHVLKLVKQ
jgi:uncharacterized lipoprotein YddW (UPF0748 family)